MLSDKELFYALVVSMQMQHNQINPLTADTSQVPDTEEAETIQDYFSEIKEAIQESETVPMVDQTSQLPVKQSNTITTDYPPGIQEIVNRINTRIRTYLPDNNYSFPDTPFILIMKFLDVEVSDLLLNDITELTNSSNSLFK